MPGGGCSLARQKSSRRVAQSPRGESKSADTIVSCSKPFYFITPSVWVCAIFISHCEFSNKWLGKDPRTKDKGLDIVQRPVRSGAQAERLGSAKGEEKALRCHREEGSVRAKSQSGWKRQGELMAILYCGFLFSQRNRKHDHQLKAGGKEHLREYWGQRKGWNRHLGEGKPEFGEMYT